MKNIKNIFVCLGLIVWGICVSFGQDVSSNQTEIDIWKTGVAREIITPETSVWMAGYSSRTTPSQGKLHDLWAKALALEDACGNRSLLITMDLLNISADFSNLLKEQIGRKHGLKKSQIIFSASHTHSGPVITRSLKYIYPMDAVQWGIVDQYTGWLEAKLLPLLTMPLSRCSPPFIYRKRITRFQVNQA